jgi:hypothetical protein
MTRSASTWACSTRVLGWVELTADAVDLRAVVVLRVADRRRVVARVVPLLVPAP